mmetsp:Transcript_26372/g.82142  ORF Transcript_26372/g.82142 Transcript_26372/m.82142 type:complete len:186 (-) Transcript_26372:1905-2462(-)
MAGGCSTILTEDEEMMRDAVRRFAQDTMGPRVREMDDASTMAPEVINGLFESGLMGIEVDEEFGGAGMNFFSACVAIEEIARVDPSVAVLVDIQNTLINNMFAFWGSRHLQETWLPRMATDTAGRSAPRTSSNKNKTTSNPTSNLTLNQPSLSCCLTRTPFCAIVLPSRSQAPVRMPSRCARART